MPPIAATAQATGLTESEVIAALQSGQTYAEIAAEADATLEDSVDIMVSAREAILAEAVAEGRITQGQMDTMLADMAEHHLAELEEAWSPSDYGNSVGEGLLTEASRKGSGYGGRGHGRGRSNTAPMYNYTPESCRR